MNDLINEAMFEMAMTGCRLAKLGYDFVEIKYGEQRLGIGPSLVLQKGNDKFICYCAEDLEEILRKEMDKNV